MNFYSAENRGLSLSGITKLQERLTEEGASSSLVISWPGDKVAPDWLGCANFDFDCEKI